MSDKNTPIEQDSSSNKSQSMHGMSNNSASNSSENLSSLARRFLWADSTNAVNRVIFWLGILCVALFVLDFFVHRHAYAPGEGMPGFYAIVGFVAFTIIVLGASQLRRLILRNENYYSPYSVDAELYPDNELDMQNHLPVDVESQEGALHDSDKDTQASAHKGSDRGDSA